MKTLQNDLTTIEQSKRLLEIGVPKDSANHYYGKDGKLHYIDGTIPYSLLWETGCTLCWSVGRLIDIITICREEIYTRLLFSRVDDHTNIENLIHYISAEIENGHVDFSKLED